VDEFPLGYGEFPPVSGVYPRFALFNISNIWVKPAYFGRPAVGVCLRQSEASLFAPGKGSDVQR